jgi:hypothetical protein
MIRPVTKILADGGDPQETRQIKNLLGFVDGRVLHSCGFLWCGLDFDFFLFVWHLPAPFTTPHCRSPLNFPHSLLIT